MSKSLDVDRLEREVKGVYRAVAEAPDEVHHFESISHGARKL